MRIIVAALILTLGACGDAPEQPAAERNGAMPLAEAPPTPEAASLALRPDGLSLLTVGSTQAEAMTFGMERAKAEAAVARAFPGVIMEQGENAECPAGPMQFSRYDALTLNFQDEKLVGWFAREGVQAATIDGIVPGITLADLERERSVAMQPSTMQGMFTYSLPDGTQISGFAEGQGGAAKVMALHAGANCFFT